MVLSKKLTHKDSNLEMTESESVALPFGDGPLLVVEDFVLAVCLMSCRQVLL